jgi:serine/threonine protein kinase
MVFPLQELRIGNVHVKLRRIRNDNVDLDSIAPQTAAVLRFLPPELRGDRRYSVRKLIGMGGMGAVVEAEDLATKRVVAMKVLLNANMPEDVARFVEEAQVTAQLEHPNIIPIYELNVNELDKPYYTMKLIRGDSLREVLRLLATASPMFQSRYPLGELLTIYQKVCDAISYAHSKGVVHRDLKPDNIMLGGYGEVVVMDWGLAKTLGHSANVAADAVAQTMVRSARTEDSDEFVTMAGRAIGTPQFMSPEQASGQSHEVDARADVYALGALLYEILTLEPPVAGLDTDEIFEKVIGGKIQKPGDAVAGKKLAHLPDGKIPEALATIAMKAMSLERDDRYNTVRELQAEVQAFQSSQERGLHFGLESWFKRKKANES